MSFPFDSFAEDAETVKQAVIFARSVIRNKTALCKQHLAQLNGIPVQSIPVSRQVVVTYSRDVTELPSLLNYTLSTWKPDYYESSVYDDSKLDTSNVILIKIGLTSTELLNLQRYLAVVEITIQHEQTCASCTYTDKNYLRAIFVNNFDPTACCEELKKFVNTLLGH